MAMTCALAAETMEDEYLAMVERHKRGDVGGRGVDLMARMMGELIEAMTAEDRDILGDLFQGCITMAKRGNSLHLSRSLHSCPN